MAPCGAICWFSPITSQALNTSALTSLLAFPPTLMQVNRLLIRSKAWAFQTFCVIGHSWHREANIKERLLTAISVNGSSWVRDPVEKLYFMHLQQYYIFVWKRYKSSQLYTWTKNFINSHTTTQKILPVIHNTTKSNFSHNHELLMCTNCTL